MKVRALVVFGAGYVVGARAGRERYAQIVDGMARASEKLDAFSLLVPDDACPTASSSRRRSWPA